MDDKKSSLQDKARTANITIRVTQELRDKVEALWGKSYSSIPFNAFLAYLVEQGIKEEKYIDRYREKRAEMKEKDEKELIKRAIFEQESSESSPSVLDGPVKSKIANL